MRIKKIQWLPITDAENWCRNSKLNVAIYGNVYINEYKYEVYDNNYDLYCEFDYNPYPNIKVRWW